MPPGTSTLGATGWLLIGSIPGVLLGSQFTVHLPERALRVALALMLALAGVKLLDPPGANGIVAGVAAAALVVGLLALARRAARPRPPAVVAAADTRRTSVP